MNAATQLAADYSIKFFGVYEDAGDGVNYNLVTPPTDKPFIDKATGQMIDAGAPVFDRNVQYIATPQAHGDFGAILEACGYTVVKADGPPEPSFVYDFQHGNLWPAGAPWWLVTGPKSDGSGEATVPINPAVVSAQIFLDKVVKKYDVDHPENEFPGAATAITDIKLQVQNAIDGKANY